MYLIDFLSCCEKWFLLLIIKSVGATALSLRYGSVLVKEHDIPSIRRFTTPDSSAATDCPSESKQGGKIQIWA